MIKYIFFLSISSIFLFQSCDEGSFSQIVEIDIPVHEPKPALKLELIAGQEQLLTLVSNSKGIVDPDSIYKVPDDAEVNVYKNGSIISNLQYDPIGLLYTSTLDSPIADSAGDEYTLEAKLPGYETVTATQTMPAKPIITNATYEIDGTIDSEGFRADEIIIDITDAAPNEINYYGAKLFYIYYQINASGDTIASYRNDIYLDTNDPLIAYGNKYSLIFTDDAFSGGTFQIRGYTYNSPDVDVGIEVELHQLSKDAFFFERSLEQYYNSIDNPFAEPVTVHNNIEGGYGIFSLSNKTIFKVM